MMNKSDGKIHIVGAGVSGLVAAKVLESHGCRSVVIERTDRVGGRVKTDFLDGFQLDHGFQVLLTSYPKAQKYLDYKALELQKILPGASVFFEQEAKNHWRPFEGHFFFVSHPVFWNWVFFR